MKTEKRGEGWEERIVKIPETADDQKRLFAAWADTWNNSIKEGGGAFGAVSLPALRICESTLENVHMDGNEPLVVEGSTHDYAMKIARGIETTKHLISDGQADSAARIAWVAGFDFAFALLKFQWEASALRGEKVSQSASKGGKARSLELSQDRKKRLSEIYRLIDAGHTKSQAAQIAAKKGFGSTRSANLSLLKRHPR